MTPYRLICVYQHSVSILRSFRQSQLAACLRGLISTLKIEALRSSKMLVNVYQNTRCYTTEGSEGGYGLGDRCSFPGRGKSFFSSSHSPASLRGPPSLSRWYRGLKRRCMKLTTHLHLVPKSRMELYLHSPISLHGIVLN
jgi:hypothetical protein